MKSKFKGSKYERDLANKLWSLGFAVLRGCSSGSGVKKRYVPDIVAIRGNKVLIIEVKYRSRMESLKLSRDKLRKLSEFASRCNGEIYLAVKYKGRDWKFIELNNTNNDIVITVHDVESGLGLEELMSKLFNKPLLDFISNESSESKDKICK